METSGFKLDAIERAKYNCPHCGWANCYGNCVDDDRSGISVHAMPWQYCKYRVLIPKIHHSSWVDRDIISMLPENDCGHPLADRAELLERIFARLEEIAENNSMSLEQKKMGTFAATRIMLDILREE